MENIPVQSNNYSISLMRLTEIGEGKSSKDSVVMMIIKGVRQRSSQILL